MASILPGDAQRRFHDACKKKLYEVAQKYGISGRMEVHDLFRACVPPARRAEIGDSMRGCVPDLMLRIPTDGRGTVYCDTLLEVKTLSFCPTRYPPNSSTPATARRAAQLQQEYDTKLRNADAKYCNTPNDGVTIGPMRAKLREHGTLWGLVFGTVGEASPDVHKLIRILSEAGAVKFGELRRSSSREAAQGQLAWSLKRQIGCEVLRGRANLLRERVMFMGQGAPTAGAQRFEGNATSNFGARNAAFEERRQWERHQTAGVSRRYTGASRFSD